jgi:glucose-1-phosphate cytidylyltransferase
MKVILLAGGRGTRIAEETSTRPKPMVEIGGRPILWHIMKIYASHGFKEFLVACGYKGEMIKEYFHNYYIHNSDYVISLRDGSRKMIKNNSDDWEIGMIDTGLDTQTGGRILKVESWVDGQTFMVTYGDGVANIDLTELVRFHHAHGKTATVTAVRPPARFGGLDLEGDKVREFSEKPQTGEGWINGGFFVFNRAIFDYLEDDHTILEREPLERLAEEGELMAYRHPGFWHPMDTLRDKNVLDELWASGQAPWQIWGKS